MIEVKYSTLIVKNLEESVAFYRDTLGFKEGYHCEVPNIGQITIMDSNGASMELIESDLFEVGFYSVGMDVDDLEKTQAELKEHGCEPISPILPTSVGRHIFILDPNGVRICLIEHTAEYKEKYMKKA